MKHIFKGVDDLCALIIVVGCIGLIAFGIDGEIKAILGVACGYIFGKRVVPAIAKSQETRV